MNSKTIKRNQYKNFIYMLVTIITKKKSYKKMDK